MGVMASQITSLTSVYSFGRRSKKTSKFRVTGLCVGNSPGTGEFPTQMTINAEIISIWWRHHVLTSLVWFVFAECCLSVAVTHNYMIQNMGTRWALGILNNASSVSTVTMKDMSKIIRCHSITKPGMCNVHNLWGCAVKCSIKGKRYCCNIVSSNKGRDTFVTPSLTGFGFVQSQFDGWVQDCSNSTECVSSGFTAVLH